MTQKPAKVLVIRNDKLGDFMLAWPALSVLKQTYPDSEIYVLIPRYTAPIARLCPWIDKIIIDDQRKSTLTDAIHLARKIKAQNFDASITLFSESRVGLAVWLSRVPLRVAPASKIYQFLHNRRLLQRRSQSKKPEYLYNVDLVNHYIQLNNEIPAKLQDPPFLSFDHKDIDAIKSSFLSKHNINQSCKLVYIHPGCGGSANNLSLQQFADLAKHISGDKLHFVITAGPGELEQAKTLAYLIEDLPHTIYHSTEGLIEFTRHIAFCDLFISGSTGPLHIAGALNLRTAAFYPTRRSASSLRWQTTNQQDRRLAFMPEIIEQDSNLSTIDVRLCAEEISAHLL